MFELFKTNVPLVFFKPVSVGVGPPWRGLLPPPPTGPVLKKSKYNLANRFRTVKSIISHLQPQYAAAPHCPREVQQVC